MNYIRESESGYIIARIGDWKIDGAELNDGELKGKYIAWCAKCWWLNYVTRDQITSKEIPSCTNCSAKKL